MAQDLTRKDSLEFVGPNKFGTGIYWFVEEHHGPRQFEQVFIPQITLLRSRLLAEDFSTLGRQRLDAYRWVSDKVQAIESLVTSSCAGNCHDDVDCVDNACRCIDRECRRK